MTFSPMNAVLQRLRQMVGPSEGDVASDAQLLTAYVDGRADAFEELVRRHGGMVQGVCRRLLGNSHDADDAFQAVFMVLARKAASLSRRESIAAWLHGVAGRTARKARVTAARRRRREETVATMTRESIADEVAEDPVGPVLDEEVNRLPEKYRLPVLLCYLEGESNEEAARRMRCSAGAVKMRLLRARELLRNRLGRRGVVIPAVALGSLLERQAASAAVPESLVASTTRAVESFTAGSAAGASGAAALAQGVIRDMYATKLKLAAAVVLGLGMAGVGVGLAMADRAPANPPAAAEPVVLADPNLPAAVKPGPAAPVKDEGPVDKAAAAARNNRFGFELLGQLSKPDANAFISPYSISAALSMTYAGARGETADEMSKVLHFAPDQERWHPAFASLSADLRPAGKEPPYQLHIANRLWGQSGAQFHDAFLKTTRDQYGAGIQPLDFKNDTEAARKTINTWVEEQTKDKIKELIGKRTLTPATRLVLTNAIYFKSAWDQPFMARFTTPEDFRVGRDTVKVPMMHQTSHYRLGEDDKLQMIDLPYQNRALSMVVVLPKNADGLAEVEKGMTAAQLDDWLKKLKLQRVELSLPKFKLLESYQVADTLRSMGMKRAFDPNQADFSGISSEPFSISQIIHKALVDVDEKGTEAAAATAVVMKAGSAAPRDKPAVFKADHPFLFLIRDNNTGAVLFLGRLVKPAA